MKPLRRLLWWLRARWDGERVHWDVDEDIRTHIALEAERLRAAGVEPGEARRRAEERFGDRERIRSDMLAAAYAPPRAPRRASLGRMAAYLRQGGRSLFHRPGPSALVVGTLAVAVAANVAVIAVRRAVLFSDAGVAGASRLVSVHAYYEALPEGLHQQPIHPLEFEDLADVEALGAAAAFKAGYFNLTGAGDPRRLVGMLTTPALFDVAGVAPMLGPGFRDVARGDERVVVLSWHVWNDILAADPAVLGSRILLNDTPYDVVGVMPPGFVFPRADDVPESFHFPQHPDIWVPYELPTTGPSDLAVVARLAPDASLESLRDQLDALARSVREQRGGGMMFTYAAQAMREQAVGPVRPVLRLLLIATLLLLVVAVGNVTGVGIARAEGRARELGIRIALGAGRSGAAAFVAAESLVLGLASGALALVLVTALLRMLRGFALPGFPGMDQVGISLPLAATTLLTALLGAAFLAVGPTLRVTRWSLADALKGARTTGSRRARRSGQWLLAAELAGTLMLLSSGVVLTQGALRLLAVDPGFDAEHVITAELTLPEATYPDSARARAVQRARPPADAEAAVPRFQRAVVQRLQQQPGIAAAAFGNPLPFAGTQESSVFWIDGMADPDEIPLTEYTVITEGYFAAMGIPLLAGREFTAAERHDGEPVAIVSESLAAMFPDGRALGGRIKLGGALESPYPWLRVVGVVADVKRSSLVAPGRPEMYVHISQGGYTSQSTSRLVVRAAEDGSPRAAMAAVRTVIHEMDPSLPVVSLAPMSDLLLDATARSWFTAQLTVGFSIIALVITALGLYSVISYSVTTRRRELALRSAIGASAPAVLREMLRETLVALAAGLAAGAAGVVLSARLLEGMVFDVDPARPQAILLAAALLAITALVAAQGPARRCLREDPVRLLSGDE
jgi:predicted permease